MKVKDLSEYFRVPLSQLRPDREINFNLYLFFPRNEHIMIWRGKGEILTQEFLNKYLERGLNSVWIHKLEATAFAEYMAADHAFNDNVTPDRPIQLDQQLVSGPRTEEGSQIVSALTDAALPDAQRAEIVSGTAQKLLGDCGSPATVSEQAQADIKMRHVVSDVVNQVSEGHLMISKKLWSFADSEPDIEHSINVATYSTIFAMAFGRVKTSLLSEIATAGLLHDIGLTQISLAITSTPWKNMPPKFRAQFMRHTDAGVALLERYLPKTSGRIKLMIGQHHEKFDGTGYPRGVKGFGFDDQAQLIALADLVDTIGSGRWDGKRKTLADVFKLLNEMESSSTFPEYFNPDIFKTAMSWICKHSVTEAVHTALKVVDKETDKLIEKRVRNE